MNCRHYKSITIRCTCTLSGSWTRIYYTCRLWLWISNVLNPAITTSNCILKSFSYNDFIKYNSVFRSYCYFFTCDISDLGSWDFNQITCDLLFSIIIACHINNASILKVRRTSFTIVCYTTHCLELNWCWQISDISQGCFT